MRLHLSLGHLRLDLAICEHDDEPEPDDLHDLSTDHPVGFTPPLGWTPDREMLTDDED